GLVDSVASLVDIFTAGASAAELFFAMLRGDATTAGKAFVNMQNALDSFQKQVGEVNFDDAENRITASIDRIKEKISEALTLKPVIQPTTIEGQTTTVTGGGGGVLTVTSRPGLATGASAPGDVVVTVLGRTVVLGDAVVTLTGPGTGIFGGVSADGVVVDGAWRCPSA
ncbi:MAG: hypothetical protein ACPG7T_09895, partial [Ilumatobacteraceae bacterium]